MPRPSSTTARSLPRLDGQTALVTGATGGLGLEVARGLARCGARVLIGGRDPVKGNCALAAIRQTEPAADLTLVPLDLAALASISACAETVRDSTPALDILVNNAGVMAPAQRLGTRDGFELQFGTNHLGHFALTAQLLPSLLRGRGYVITVASLAAWKGQMPFDDLNAHRHYTPFARYRQSKLANLAFALELDRRARLHGGRVHSRAAHPGWSSSDIIANSAALGDAEGRLAQVRRDAQKIVGGAVFHLLGQTVQQGARPILYALSPDAMDGGYYGPLGTGERRGPPGPAPIPPAASDPALAARLWAASEDLTGVHFEWGAP